MLKLRLQRRGKNNYATYRVVVADQHAPLGGRFVEDVGAYNPHTNLLTVTADRVKHWLQMGAKPSATLHNLLVNQGVLTAPKMTIWKPPKQAAPAAATAPVEAATSPAAPEESAPTA